MSAWFVIFALGGVAAVATTAFILARRLSAAERSKDALAAKTRMDNVPHRSGGDFISRMRNHRF